MQASSEVLTYFPNSLCFEHPLSTSVLGPSLVQGGAVVGLPGKLLGQVKPGSEFRLPGVRASRTLPFPDHLRAGKGSPLLPCLRAPHLPSELSQADGSTHLFRRRH